MNKRVLMAMSGGIDSSVAAILLQEKGYELVGVTFRIFDTITDTDNGISRENDSCLVDSIMEAKNIAEQLGFEHHILDVRKKFKDIVIKNFIDEYLQCRTPNPCVICNPAIKWGLLLDMADEYHCNYLATGHYAQIRNNNGRYYLQCGKDSLKDQSYFLWKLTQTNLARTLFPLGELTKKEVRKIAAEHGFVKLSKKKESEEICFITDNNYRNFLEKKVDNLNEIQQKGDFVNISGEILGQHDGLYNYTIGQRKGLRIALGKPVYVVAIDKINNRIVLGNKNDLKSYSLIAKNVNLMKYSYITDGMEITCRIRYRNPGTKAMLFNNGDNICVNFKEPVESITPGQSAVFYENDDLIGGGIIC